jgi:hypothetical protein
MTISRRGNMDRTRWLSVVITLCFCWSSGEALAARNWQSLREVQGLEVVIGDLNPDAVKDGLNRSLLQADVGRMLSRAGINVVSREERLQTPGAPWLYVTVSTVKTKFGSHVYSVSVGLFQEALLASNGISTSVQTWERGSFGMTRSEGLRRIREAVTDLVGVFIKDYLAMNPP